jgi:hypothetical protein
VVDPAAVVLVGWIQIQEGKITHKARKSLTLALLRQSVGYRLRMKQGRKGKQR